MGKALSYIGGILLAVLCALLIVPHVVDWNSFRGAFEEEASRVLGREVRVGGGVNLRLLPSPYVRFEKIRISDTAGTLGEPFFRAESFTMGLAVAPLLRAAMEATHIELRQPVLSLAVDGEGRGNWRDVAIKPGALSLMPAEVRLNAVEIIDGLLTVKGGDGELVRLSAINGELSADSLTGPFKFRGLAGWQGEAREVRLSTAQPEADGGMRFKVFVRPQASGASYTVDGLLSDLGARPRIDGEMVARVPLAAAAAGGAALPSRKPDDRDLLDVRAKLSGDAFGVTLPDVTLSFEQGGQPQLVSGTAEASWRDGLRFKVALDSRWLDLDRLAASTEAAGPVSAARVLVPALVGLLPQSGQVDARVSVDQVNLGGEVASDVRLHLERFRGPMQMRELHLALPGGSRLDMSGQLAVDGAETRLAGDLALRGTSYARFLGWAAKGQTLIDTRNDGPFVLLGRIGLSGKSVELSDLSAELLGAPPITGLISYGWDGRRRLEFRLDGPQIDVSSILPGGLDPARVKSLLWPALPSRTEAKVRPLGGFDPDTTDVRLVLRAGELGDGERVLREVDAVLAIEQGRLQVSTLRLVTPEGLRLDVEGDVADVTGRPKGTLSGDFSVPTPAALEELLATLDLLQGEAGKSRNTRLERLLPGRLAGTVQLGARSPASTDVTLDGTMKGSRAMASMRLDAGPHQWRDGAVEARGTIESADVALALTELMLDDGAGTGIRENAYRGGQFAFALKGEPKSGLLSTAHLKADGLRLEFDGKITDTTSGGREVDGLVRFDAGRAQPVLGLLGIGALGSFRDAQIAGTAEISIRGGAMRIKPHGATVAGSEVAGTLTITRITGSATEIYANLQVPRVTVAGLLAPVLQSDTGRGVTSPTGQARDLSPIWPDRPFDFSVLDAVRGRIKMVAGTLEIDGGFGLSDVTLDIELAPGQLKVANLDGRALGGEVKARLVLEKAPMAGAALAGAVRMDEARLEAIAGKAAAAGAAGLIVQFSGRALSPFALMTVLQGKGEINLGAGQLTRMSPSTVPRAVEAVLSAKAEPGGDSLKRLLRDGLAAGPVRIGPAKLAVQIGEGAIKVQKLTVETDEARATAETTVELATLKVDSEWRMEPKGPPPRTSSDPAAQPSAASKVPVPGITLVYVGPLRDVATLEPRFSIDALERVLTVLRMERDVEELERLRREDEARIKREAERQRALEDERMRALEATRANSLSPPLPSAPSSPPSAQHSTTPGPLPPPSFVAPPPSAATRFVPPPSAVGPPLPLGPPTTAGPEPTTGRSDDTAGVPAPEPAKRPARLGPPRPTAQPQPKLNPFGPSGLGTN
jgi:hypothetical protein